MRMRHKKWTGPELSACGYYREEPREERGRWADQFQRRQPIHLELGCGKGVFTASLCALHPENNYLAVDLSPDVLACAKRNIEAACGERGRAPDNIFLILQDISKIELMLSPNDRIERLYINFCNPWPKAKHHKRRLTHPNQLKKYKAFLVPGGELYFKTDDDDLYLGTRGYLAAEGFEILEETKDLHAAGYEETVRNYSTEHERMFTNAGIPIKFIRARLAE